jgi:hypothetical protein
MSKTRDTEASGSLGRPTHMEFEHVTFDLPPYLSRSRCLCCSFTVPSTAAFSPRRSTTDIGSPLRTRWRSSPRRFRHRGPTRSRNGSRHGPSRGSLIQAEVRTADNVALLLARSL